MLVLRADFEEVRLGGAASVAGLLIGLEASVCLAGVVGDDASGRVLRKLFDESGIDASAVMTIPDRPTTSKERFMGRAAGRHPHQMLRVDHEECQPLDAGQEETLFAPIRTGLERFDAILISDYAKGCCAPRLLHDVIQAASQLSIPVLVDPARIADFERYCGATLLKPNRVEMGLAVGVEIRDSESACIHAKSLCDRLEIQSIVVTLDQDGMALVTADGRSEHFPVVAQAVYDITGAGDMALAALGLCIASGWDLADSVRLANIASGIEVGRQGVAIISRDELSAALGASVDTSNVWPGRSGFAEAPEFSTRHLVQKSLNPAEKVVNLPTLLLQIAEHRRTGRRIVFTNGCFDLLHVGHLRCLEQAAELGNVLIVAINSDDSVRRLKGPDRPIIPDHDRATLLTGLSCVDHVLIFTEDTPHRILHAIRPDILAKGGTTAEFVGREIVEQYGGQIRRLGEVEGKSTTSILAGL